MADKLSEGEKFDFYWLELSYFRYRDERRKGHRDDEIDPEEPTEKNEVGRNGGTKMRFYFHDTDLPRYEPRLQIDQLASKILPLLDR